jgi:hypothetical protein
VSAPLIDEAAAQIPEPKPPVVFIEEKGREEPNPSDPDYLYAISRLEMERSLASVDVVIMLGVDLVNEDGTPFEISLEDKWYRQLKLLAKHGRIDLSRYDFEDEDDVEFVFKKYIAVGTSDIPMLTAISGLDAEEVDKAVKTFRGD